MTKILRVLTSRVGLVAVILLLQLLWILITVFRVSQYHVYISAVFTVMGFCLVIYITQQWKDPAYKLLWCTLIMGVPLVGCILYLLFGRFKDVSIYMKRYRVIRDRLDAYAHQDKAVLKEIGRQDEPALRQVNYLTKHCGFPIYGQTKAEYFPDGEEYFASLCDALESARSFIFLEYFIIGNGMMWDKLLTIMRSKAAAGVEVRVLYDDLGCYNLPFHYSKVLESYGIKCRRFNPLRPVLAAIMNNRDHRKVVVVDGRIAFTGGVNLSDEYIHKKERFGFWKDCGIRLDGEAAASFTRMFLEMWDATGSDKENADNSIYLEPEQAKPERSEKEQPEFSGPGDQGYVQPYADNPLDDEFIGANVYLNMIHYAVNYIYFFTPYLILDEEILRALTLAAKNGVDVRIVTPHIPDKKLIFMVTRSYYLQLLTAGVRIYEYTPGFIHSKCCICDGKMAAVGSVNLDYRSFYLHFEDGVLLYRSPAIDRIYQDFAETFEQSMEISVNYMGKLPWIHRLIAVCMRLIAPMF